MSGIHKALPFYLIGGFQVMPWGNILNRRSRVPFLSLARFAAAGNNPENVRSVLSLILKVEFLSDRKAWYIP
jgi:hypothetical protein